VNSKRGEMIIALFITIECVREEEMKRERLELWVYDRGEIQRKINDE
jgi:hypothetical protein